MMIPKAQPVRSKKLRDAARGQECTLRFPGICRHDTETTVLAHSPIANGGMSTKGSDINGAFACSSCHDVVDGRTTPWGVPMREIYECWIRGHQETVERWRDMGLISVKGAA